MCVRQWWYVTYKHIISTYERMPSYRVLINKNLFNAIHICFNHIDTITSVIKETKYIIC